MGGCLMSVRPSMSTTVIYIGGYSQGQGVLSIRVVQFCNVLFQLIFWDPKNQTRKKKNRQVQKVTIFSVVSSIYTLNKILKTTIVRRTIHNCSPSVIFQLWFRKKWCVGWYKGVFCVKSWSKFNPKKNKLKPLNLWSPKTLKKTLKFPIVFRGKLRVN